MKINKKAAVIIVNWNGLKYLNDCFQAVFNQTYNNYDIYFVDNGSVDGSVKFVENKYPKAKIIKLNKNTGFARGNNIAIEEAFKNTEVKYIVFLNNDTIVNKNWLKELVKTVEQNKNIGMVSSKTLFKNKTIHNIGLSIEKNRLGNKTGGNSVGYSLPLSRFTKNIEIFSPSGVSALYERRVLENIGFFDEDFFAYAEDSDLGFRARLAGYKCIYNPKSKLIHLHSQTGGVASPFKAYHVKRNAYFVAIKNFSLPDLLAYPFRDFYWNIKQIFAKNKLNSVNKLKNEIGFIEIVKITVKVYFNVFINFPKMIKKRYKIRKNIRVSSKEYKMWFNKFNRNHIENNF